MNILEEFSDIFIKPGKTLPAIPGVLFDVELKDGQRPIRKRVRRFTPKELPVIDKELDRMEMEGVIVRSKSEWGAALVVAYKPDGSIRICINYAPLNKVIAFDPYPLPNHEDCLLVLKGKLY